MKIARLAGLMLVAIMAMSFAVSSVAMAAPEFKPTGATITGTSGTAKLVAGGNTVTCSTSGSTGTITSATLAGNVVVNFLGCTSSGSGGSNCATKSTNTSTAGLILTTTLHGVLGTTSSGAAALLLLPISGKRFVTLEANTCTIETAVTGNVAGLVEPTGKSQTTGTLKFALTSGKNISVMTLSTGGSTEPALTAFSTSATEEVTEGIKFSTATEVS
jgi:hypothetical protein